MSIRTLLKHATLVGAMVWLAACGGDDALTPESRFGVFSVIDDTTVEMDGDITRSTLNDLRAVLDAYPNITQINMLEVPGSTDDEINLQAAQLVHDRQIATHLIENGLIASGGVDFFLAGTVRTKGTNAQIGVHSWSDGTNEATDFPEGHANHQPYIAYYQAIGFTQASAEAFYYFTINAASAESIHWMTEAEIERYGILTP